MPALRIHGAGDLRHEQLPVPRLQEGWVLLEVTAAGICGTDAALLRHGGAIVAEDIDARWPVVLGHEFAGVVVDARGEVGGLEMGDLVACGAGVSCGRCRACGEGRTNLCENYWTAGIHRDGGLARYCAVPAAICEPTLPHGVEGDAAGLAQPMAIALHAVERGLPREGERALIFGAGGIGAFATWAASRAGLKLTVCDREPERLRGARELGADATVLAGSEGLPEDLAAGEPWDLVYEMTGAAGPLGWAEQVTRPGGRIVAAGIQKGRASLDLGRLSLREIDLIGTVAHRRSVDLPGALALLGQRRAGWADLAPRVHSLAEAAERVLPDLVAGRAGAVKILVDPRAEAGRPYAL